MNGVELVASTSDVAFVTDLAGTIHAWNAAAEECFNRPAEQVIGRTCWEVLEGRDLFGNQYCGPSCPLLRMALAGEMVRRCQLSFRDASGKPTSYSVATLFLRGPPLGTGTALVHLMHRLLPDQESQDDGVARPRGNHARGEMTPREREVLAQLLQGASTAEIARLLCISTKTARNHIQSILHKLHVHSRLEAVAVARRARLG